MKKYETGRPCFSADSPFWWIESEELLSLKDARKFFFGQMQLLCPDRSHNKMQSWEMMNFFLI